MIKPTIGRVVLIVDRRANMSGQVEPALVTYVHNDTCINVGGFDTNGAPFAMKSVRLMQGDPGEAPPNSGGHAEWMPYQKGQAAKTEALEAAAAKT